MAKANTPDAAPRTPPATPDNDVEQFNLGPNAAAEETAIAMGQEHLDEVATMPEPEDKQDEGIQEGESQETAEPEAETEAETPQAEEPQEEVPQLAAEDEQALQQRYGQEYVEKLRSDPAFRREVTRGITAARQKDKAKLDQAQHLMELMKRLPPETLAQLIAAQQGQPAQQPQAQEAPKPPKLNLPEYEGRKVENWNTSDLARFLSTDLPQYIDQVRQQAVQEATSRPRPEAAILAQQYADQQVSELVKRGYTDAPSRRDEIWARARALANNVPNLYDGTNDTEIWEQSYLSLPGARLAVANARAQAATQAETARQQHAKREAAAPSPQRQPVRKQNTSELYNRLSEMRAQGQNVDDLVVLNDPLFQG